MDLNETILHNLNEARLMCNSVEDLVDFRLFDLDELEEGQIGYSIDPKGNTLVSHEEGLWIVFYIEND